MPDFKKRRWEKPSLKSFDTAEEIRAFYASKGTAAERAALARILDRLGGKTEHPEMEPKDIRRRRYG